MLIILLHNICGNQNKTTAESLFRCIFTLVLCAFPRWVSSSPQAGRSQQLFGLEKKLRRADRTGPRTRPSSSSDQTHVWGGLIVVPTDILVFILLQQCWCDQVEVRLDSWWVRRWWDVPGPRNRHMAAACLMISRPLLCLFLPCRMNICLWPLIQISWVCLHQHLPFIYVMKEHQRITFLIVCFFLNLLFILWHLSSVHVCLCFYCRCWDVMLNSDVSYFSYRWQISQKSKTSQCV